MYLIPANAFAEFKRNVRYGLCGFGLLIVSYALFFFDPVEIIKSAKLKFVEGSFAYQLWQKPPVKVYINVYIFNVTNADRFLSGQDDKLNVVEIGPYVYWEELENTNCTFYSNDTVTYVPRRKLHFELKSSVGNPETDRIIIPNLPLLGFSSMLKNSPMFVNLVFNSLVNYLDSQPLLDLTVKEFLWGYDDRLVKMASNVLPTWINFAKFGLLDRMLDEGTNVVRMTVPSNKQKLRPYSIDQFNGSPILHQWVKNDERPQMNKCSLNASSEGLLFPRHLTTDMNFLIYRKAFCRTFPATYSSTSETPDGYPVFLYKFLPSVFNSSLDDNKCYCPKDGCLPPGLSDISPCYYNIPVAVSFPHFYGGDPSLMDHVNGLSPDKEKHESTIAVQPDLGIPLAVNIKIQLNLVMKRTTNYGNRVEKFNGLTLPICWLKLEVKGLPKSLNSLLYLCFNLGPVLVKAIVALTASMGFFLVGLTVRRFGKDQQKHHQQQQQQQQQQQLQLTNGSDGRRGCYGDGGDGGDDDGDNDHDDDDDYDGDDGTVESGLITKHKSGQQDSGKWYLPLHIVPTSSVVVVEYSQDYARSR